MISVKAWMDETEIPSDIDVWSDLQEWGIYAAMEEQSKIGWNNFMKGQITPKFGVIQMKAYGKDDTLQQMPAHYSATWWTAGLIKEIIYLSLNVWQQRNKFLHDNETMSQAISDREEALAEVADWYEKKNTHALKC